MSAEDRAFIERIRQNPSDDGPRLVYADWLDDIGLSDRAEFIRLQCALATMPANDPRRSQLQDRERDLKETHGPDWAGSLARHVAAWEFRRGMIESIALEARRFLALPPDVFVTNPIRRVRLFETAGAMPDVCDSPNLKFVRELDLCGEEDGNIAAGSLARTKRLHHLEVLELGLTNLGDRALQLIAGSPNFLKLRTLNINDNTGIGISGLRALSDSQFLPDLRSLELSGNGLGAAELQAVLSGRIGQNLDGLSIHNNPISDRGLQFLIESPAFVRTVDRTRQIQLRHTGLSERGAVTLANCPGGAGAEILSLDNNVLRDDGLGSLSRSRYFRKLRVLSLRENHISDDGIYALSLSPMMKTLELIDLSGNLVTQSSIHRLYLASTDHDWRAKLDVIVDSQLKSRPLLSSPMVTPPQVQLDD